MALFKIHVVSKEQLPPGFFTELEKLFSLCRRDSNFDDFSAFWWTHRPIGRAAHEPIVWMLKDKSQSIIKKVYQNVPISPTAAGQTYWKDQGTISEVYLNDKSLITPSAKAKMAFHELMHNKLQKGDELHSSSYGTGLNLGSLNLSDDGTQLDWDNKDMMAAALGKVVPQYEPPF
jgi:hypothetical protein